MKRIGAILLLLAAFGCGAVPYRADLETDGAAHLSTDLRYFLVEALGAVVVRAVDKGTGNVVWEREVPAATAKAWRREGRLFEEVTVEEAKRGMGIAEPVVP